MKFTIENIATLRPILLTLKKKLAKHSIGFNLMIRTNGSTVEFVTGGEHCTKVLPVVATVEEQGCATIELEPLDKMVAKLHKRGGQVSFELDEESGKLTATHEKLTAKLDAGLSEDFVMYNDESVDGVEFEAVDAKPFQEALKSCAKAMSGNSARMNLCGVYLTGDKAVSTDGHRLRVKTVSGAKFDNVIVPAAVVSLIDYMIGKFKPESVNVGVGDNNKLVIKIGEHRIYTESIAGTFPDYTRVLPALDESGLIFTNRETLLDSVDNVSIFSNKRTSDFTMDVDDADGITLSAEDKAGTKGEVNLPCEYGRGPVKAKFNHKYLTEALKDLDTTNVAIQIIDTLTAVLVMNDDSLSKDDCWIVMPMRL